MIELVQTAFDGAIIENFAAMVTMAVGYIALCVIVPALCLRKLVAQHDLAYRLVFYQVCGQLYLIAVSFALAFSHLYYPAVLWALLVVLPLGVRAWFGRRGIKAWLLNLVHFSREISKGAYNGLRTRKALQRWIKKHASFVYDGYLKGHLVTYLVWAALTVLAVAFFGYFKLHYCSYAMTDEETHLYWIQSLLDDNAFPAGMYPHGEHFLVGAIVSLLGVQVARNWLAFSMVSALSIFFAAYLFSRKIFSSRAGVLFAFAVFVAFDLMATTTYYRYQYSLPMEYALSSLFFMLYALVDYMENHSRTSLLLFGGALALTFQNHFYVTIFAIMLLLGYAVVLAIPAFKQKVLHKIVICAIASLLLSVMPFAIGYACGFSFERSINWAVEIAQGGDGSASLNTGSEESSSDEDTEEELQKQEQIANTRAQALAIRTPLDAVNFVANVLSREFSRSMEAGQVVACLALGTCLYGLLGVAWCLARKKKGVLRYQLLLGYGVSWIVGFVAYGAAYLGLPQIIYSTRAAIFLSIYSVGLFALPFQIAFDALSMTPVKARRLDVALCAASAVLFAAFCQIAPIKSIENLYYEFAIQHADMYACEKLMDENLDHTWTIISPTNDLSAIRRNGYHYEIVDLMEEIEDGETEIYIPTPDIAVVVENPVFSFATGYIRQVDGSDFAENTFAIDPAQALKTYDELGLSDLASRDRAYYDLRVATMSKIYYWMEKVKQVYPAETTIYYQDEYCTVYRIHQDEYFLLNLAVDYTDLAEKALADNNSKGGNNE